MMFVGASPKLFSIAMRFDMQFNFKFINYSALCISKEL